jgi:hypothetical protein
VLAELVAAGGLSWACQLPGDSLPSCALDLAAQGGHLPVLTQLREKVRIPSSTFLTGEGGGAAAAAGLDCWCCGCTLSSMHLRPANVALHAADA